MSTSSMGNPKIVSRDEWLAARKELLIKEKHLTREYDAIRALRRELPWVKVEKQYSFEGPNGKVTLADLFDGRSQLIVRHFMFGPGWKEGCVGCSFASDHVDGARVHLEHHDVTYVAVSRAPWPEIEAFKHRMGWGFPWVSSYGSDFNYDYHVSFTKEELDQGRAFYNFESRDLAHKSEEGSGLSVFHKGTSGEIFHTYSCHARGDEGGLTTYFYLDLRPKGRDENGPTYSLGDWVRHHDRYGAGGYVAPTGRYVPPDAEKVCHQRQLSMRKCREIDDAPTLKLETPRSENNRPLLIAGLTGRCTAGTLDEIPALWENFSAHLGRIPGK